MSFKENLLKKIQISQLTRKVLASFGSPESASKIDKDAMRSLLDMSPYLYHRERDLDLFIEKLDGEQSKILVLDNELPIYRTTVEDVAIRKSPYTKEMLSIGNIIKILKDSDVKISRREESVQIIQKECIDRLDLSYNASDIEMIAKEGADSLENGYTDGILESLAFFAELLGYQPAPKAFRIRHHEIVGAVTEKQGGQIWYGPAVVLSLIDNSLGMIEDKISSLDKAKIEHFQQVAQGKEKPSVEGKEVFRYLTDAVLMQ
ncbi:hypothetical protein D1BOALGB6SA_1629 [Olavius sp. associated proteobacterium Delta 1]|nr:hypothetical protein D1BOALGB6SA_1629 [Olavius sp. associated proteobacterium Delta 1]